MADEIVWLRCKKCMATLRLLAYDADWRCCFEGTVIKQFIDKHIEGCYADVRHDHLDDETFFELVTFKDVEKVFSRQPLQDPKETSSGEENAG